MADMKTRSGAAAPLLERLIDDRPLDHAEPRPLRVVGPAELRAAVGRDLARLLNTRSPVAWNEWSDRERTVLDYGVPDFTALHPANSGDRMRLGAMVEQCITTFEPRLRSVRVHVQPRGAGDPRTLMLRIDALLAVDDIREPVSFPVVLRERGEVVVEVSGDE